MTPSSKKKKGKKGKMERAEKEEEGGCRNRNSKTMTPLTISPIFSPTFTASTATNAEPNAEKAAPGRTTRRSALLSGGQKDATPKQKSAVAANAPKLTPARGLGAMMTSTNAAITASTPASTTSSRGGGAASGGILTPRKRPLLQSSTVITLSGSAAAAAGAPPPPPSSAAARAATAAAKALPLKAPSLAAAASPLLPPPPSATTTATARAAALVSGLPEPHAALAAAFAALHSAAALVRGRGGQRLTFEGSSGRGAGSGNNHQNCARAAVERATGRRFSVRHLLQMRALYPEGVELEYVNPPGVVVSGSVGFGGVVGVVGGGDTTAAARCNLPPMLLSIRVRDPPAGSAREEFARRLRGAAEAAARRAAREAEGRCRSPAASGCRKSRGGTRARTGGEEEEMEAEGEEEEAATAPAAEAEEAEEAEAAALDPVLLLPEAPLPPLPAGRVAATPHFAPSASAAAAAAAAGKEEGEEKGDGKPTTTTTAFPRPPLAPSSSSSASTASIIASRARQRLTFGDAGGAAAVGAAAAALSDAEVLRASLPPELAKEAIEGTKKNGSSSAAAPGLADLPLSAVRAAHAAQARRDAVSDPRRAEARARSALLALLPRAFVCARAAFGGGSGAGASSGLRRIPGGRPPTPTPCVKPLSLVHDALSRAVLGSSSASFPATAIAAAATGGSSSSNSAAAALATVLDAPALLLRELAAAAPDVFSIEAPRLGREAEGPVLRVNRAADAGAARARLAAAAAADRASNAA